MNRSAFFSLGAAALELTPARIGTRLPFSVSLEEIWTDVGAATSPDSIVFYRVLGRKCDGLGQLPWNSIPHRGFNHTISRRSLRALIMTDTELKLMAAAAMIGLKSRPKNGNRTPAAIGTPAAL